MFTVDVKQQHNTTQEENRNLQKLSALRKKWINMVVYPYSRKVTNLLLCFFDYKTVVFFLSKNPKILDPTYKMDLDLWNC